MTSPASDAHSVAWERSVWQGEPAWCSDCAGVRAIVSEARCRLIYLGTPDGARNLINAPWPRVLPSKDQPWPNQGGHRFWLGPQHRWVWPPPSEWEYASALEARCEGGVLILRHPHLDTAFPELTREYAWEDGRLRCTVRWPDDGRAHFGLHVLAIDTPCRVTARLAPTAEAPAGLVVARMVDPEPPIRLPHPAVEVSGDQAVVSSDIERVKLGFIPQPLVVERPGGWRLAMHPGPARVVDGGTPDHGYLSQVWVGDASYDLAELEQLTPHLRGDGSGACSSTIFIEARPPASPA